MPGIDRNAARYAWTVAVVLLALVLVYLVRQTLFIFVLALLFAYLLSPLVDLLDRVLPASRTRTPALALAYVIFVAAAVLGGIQIGSRVVEQAALLSRSFPETLRRWQQAPPPNTPAANSLQQQVMERARQEVAKHSSDLLAALPQASMKLLGIVSNVIYVVIIPVLAFFFLKDARGARQHFLELVEDGPRRDLLDDVLDDVHLLLAHYMRALVVLSFATFVAYSIFFAVLGVPYAVLLSVLAAVLEFIPMVGPLSASIVILVVGGASGASLPAILIFLVAYRMFQDYFLSPHLMGQGVELHPLLVLFGVFAGAEVAGVAGTFLSVPLLALARIVYVRMRRARTRLKVAGAAADIP